MWAINDLSKLDQVVKTTNTRYGIHWFRSRDNTTDVNTASYRHWFYSRHNTTGGTIHNQNNVP